MNKAIKKQNGDMLGIAMNIIVIVACFLSIFGAIGAGLFIKDILMPEETNCGENINLLKPCQFEKEE